MLKSRRKRGFTLIELLVVIAIIALLLSIVVPSLKKAKEHAQRVIGYTNLRSLSTALHIYLNTNDDRFFGYDGSVLWMDYIGDIVDNIDEVRYCPRTTRNLQVAEERYQNNPGSHWGEAEVPWVWGASSDTTKKYELGSYGLNGWMYAETAYAGSYQNNLFGRRTAVRSPSQTPFVLDAVWPDGWPRSTNTLPANYNYDLGAQDITHGNADNNYMMGRYVTNRHGSVTNVIFVDGQVKSVPLQELWALSWHKGYQPRYDVELPKPVPTGQR